MRSAKVLPTASISSASDVVTEGLPHKTRSVFYDGQSSRRHIVTLAFEGALRIVEDGKILAVWAWPDIRKVDGSSDRLRLTATTAPDLARLDIADEALKQEIVARCGNLDAAAKRSWAANVQVVGLILLAFASIGGLLWFGIPFAAERLAPVIPIAWEKRLGDAADKQVRTIFSGKHCEAPSGVAALRRLSDALTEKADLPIAPEIEVVQSTVPNAFALPGGKIYLLKGLLTDARSPDEIAGVLAHELGHVRHRDHLRRLIANGGTAYVVGLLFGDVTGAGALLFATRALLGAAHSRDAETNADRFAAQIMTALGRSTIPMGDLLLRVDRSSDDSFSLVRDHPLSATRMKELKALDAGERGPPLLTEAEWTALQAICD